jgi:hypothetical protein
MIKTYHGDKMIKVKTKPVSVLDYNQNMTGVLPNDQLLHTYILGRKKVV